MYVGTQMYRSVYICEYVWIYTQWLVKSILVHTLLLKLKGQTCVKMFKKHEMYQRYGVWNKISPDH